VAKLRKSNDNAKGKQVFSFYFRFLCLYAKFYIPLHWIIHKEEDERIQKLYVYKVKR